MTTVRTILQLPVSGLDQDGPKLPGKILSRVKPKDFSPPRDFCAIQLQSADITADRQLADKPRGRRQRCSFGRSPPATTSRSRQTPTRPVLLGPGGVSRVGMATAPNSGGRLTIRSVKFVRSGTESPQGTNMTAPGRERSTSTGLEVEDSSVAPPADHVTRRGPSGPLGARRSACSQRGRRP